MTWRQLTEGLQRVEALGFDLHDRDTWRSGVRSAMHAAGHLPRGATDVDIGPVHAS